MIGQGGPTTSLRVSSATAWLHAVRRGRWCAPMLGLVLSVLLGSATTSSVFAQRIRIAFGGGQARLWDGSVTVSRGTLSDPRPLGIEADEPGSMWVDDASDTGGSRLLIRQRSARSYDAVEVEVNAPADSQLQIRLVPADEPDRAVELDIPLQELFDGYVDKPLDSRGNRLLIHRAPGDSLAVRFARDSLVFAPEEEFALHVQPRLLKVKPGTKLNIDVKLLSLDDGRELMSSSHQATAADGVEIPLNITLPSTEGVFDLAIIVNNPSQLGLPDALRQPLRPLNLKRPIAERRLQLVVVGENAVARSARASQLQPVVEIDPASPRWKEKLGLDKLPQFPKLGQLLKVPKEPFGNGMTSVRTHALGELVQLNPNAQSPDVSWQAYPLPIDAPGKPHVLEVEYPSDVQQTLAISVLEPNVAGGLMPIGLDSGVDNQMTSTVAEQSPRWLRHRIVFWPRTEQPMVLLANRGDQAPAVFGKIRVLAGWEHLPAASSKAPDSQGRLVAAYFDRPLFPENFGADGSAGAWVGRSLDDWRTFHQGGSRLVEYLHYTGYNGAMLTVLADGSAIYPSEVVQPTPRHDTGAFLTLGQDPVRKDVLEMLFRLFDREELRLVPTLQFAAPLPELEVIRRQHGAEADGIEWVGPEGKTWCQVNPTRRGLAPYYNVLHPRVQEAMLTVVREVASRYAHHPSFAGLAIQLSADGYAILPGAGWGMDDQTVAQFAHEYHLDLPKEGPKRFAQRAALLDGEYRQAWLQWRATELARFYRQVHEELNRARDGAPLYLAGVRALGGHESQSRLRPALRRRSTIAEALLEVGVDARHYQGIPNLVLLRPETVVSSADLATLAASLEVQQMPDVDEYFRRLPVTGSLFYHPPQQTRVRSFDEVSPFKPSYTELVSQVSPSSSENRRRFVHSVASLDSQVMLDGGWLLPLGQEDELRTIITAYRSLPAKRFQDIEENNQRPSTQPVTFRYVTSGGQTYVYAVNDAPFAVTAQVRMAAAPGTRLEELTGQRQVAPLWRDVNGTSWTVDLEPYDLVAVRLSQPGVHLVRPQVTLPGAVQEVLNKRIRELGTRAAMLRNAPPVLTVLSNPSFERTPVDDRELPEWAITQRAGVQVVVDRQVKRSGEASARIKSTGPVACLVSRPFTPPATGRLSMSVWLRVADAKKQPPLYLAIEGRLADKTYYRFAPVGGMPNGAAGAVPLGTQWAEYVFQVDDLPLEGLSQLSVRFDMMGEGEVWVDDVQLSELRFTHNEVTELTKLITLAHVTLQKGQVTDCMRLLDGYWPRFLETHVPLRMDNTPMVGTRRDLTPAAETDTPSRTGFFDRMRGLLPKKLW